MDNYKKLLSFALKGSADRSNQTNSAKKKNLKVRNDQEEYEFKIFSNNHKKIKRKLKEMPLIDLDSKTKVFVDEFPKIIVEEKNVSRGEWFDNNFNQFEEIDQSNHSLLSKLLEEQFDFKEIKDSIDSFDENNHFAILKVFSKSDPNNRSIHYYCESLRPKLLSKEEKSKIEKERSKKIESSVFEFNCPSNIEKYYSNASKQIKKKQKLEGYVIPHEGEVID